MRTHRRRLHLLLLPVALLALLGALSLARDVSSVWATAWEDPKNIVGTAPPIIEPGSAETPPSDAIVLFDGKSLAEWESRKQGNPPAAWVVEDGCFTVNPGTGDIRTKRSFGDMQLHLEWRLPERPAALKNAREGGENMGNSGIKLHEAYEIQILDSWRIEKPHRPSGMAGAVYKQHVPLVNACRAPGEWQTYDLVFRAPRFDEAGQLLRHGTVTLLHNGVLIHDHVRIWGRTNSPAEDPKAYKNPFFLQDHGAPVSYRNIWVRELTPEAN